MKPKDILKAAKLILVIDWPSKEVPELLAQAGFQVVVRGGPGPEDYAAYKVNNGQVVTRRIGHAPERADLIYSFRPVDELPGIIALAQTLRARAIWTQSGLTAGGTKDPKGCWLSREERQRVRELVRWAGLTHISEPYIGDVARDMRASGGVKNCSGRSPLCQPRHS